MTAEAIRRALQCDNPSCACHKPTGNVHCPAHEDSTPSLAVTEKDGKILVKDHSTKCSQARVISRLKEMNLWPSGNGDRLQAKARIVDKYDYHDAAGKLIFQVCRMEPKDFRQRRPDPQNPGKWLWNLKGVDRVPYRLPEVLKADRVFICEGEKDCDRLVTLGLEATTNAGGAGKWHKAYSQHFRGKQVIILSDNDQAGRDHAQQVARHLHGVAASIKIIELPGLPEKGDVSDWIQRCKGIPTAKMVGALMAMVTVAPEWEPDPEKGVPAQEEKGKQTQAEILIKLAADAELFHDENPKGFATVDINSHRETWPIRSKGFRSWLLRRFFQATGKAPGAQAMQDALGVLEAQAHFDGPEHVVHVRVAHKDGKIYIDLANDSWQAVEITTSGWQVVVEPPVKFRRPRGLAPMPEPKPGSSLNALKVFVNCKPEDWPLVVAWIIGAFSCGPYPILIVWGEQGSAKSTIARILKSLVDPGSTALRTVPRDERDLMIGATNSWCLSFDNLSGTPPWLSDSLCRLSTGGGLATRELYSDDAETIFNAMRPQILNGIDSMVNRGDLASRAILLELPLIGKGRRRSEKDLWKAFEAAQPGILGAVFDALSAALANVHQVKLAELPRMADFAIWVSAAEPALPWKPGTFLDIYSGNQAAVIEHSLEGDVVAVAVRALMADRETWEGAPSGLLEALEALVPESTKRSKSWPKAANSLSNRLWRASTFLRAVGIEFESGYVQRSRRFFFRKGMQKTVATVATVASEENQGVTCNDPCNDATIHEKRSLQPKPGNHAGCNDSNDCNDEIPTHSKVDDKEIPVEEVEL